MEENLDRGSALIIFTSDIQEDVAAFAIALVIAFLVYLFV